MKRIVTAYKKSRTVYGGCHYQELEIGSDHVGVLDYPEHPAENYIRQGGNDKRAINGNIRFFKPVVDEIESDDEDEGVGYRLYRIIGLFVPDWIDVIFVYEITNHP